MRRTQRNEKVTEIKKTIRSKKADVAIVLPASLTRKTTKKPLVPKVVRLKKSAVEEVKIPTVLKRAVRSRAASTKQKAKVEIPPESVKREAVFVPSTASLRLLEKVEVYRLWYKNNFPTYVASTARVGGYAFVLLGTLFASFGYISHKDLFGPAATICTEVDCVEISDAELPPDAPLVTFLNSLPAELITDTDIILRAENTGEPKVSLRHVESGEYISLPATEVMERGEYKYLIRHDLKSGTYILHAEARDGAITYKFSGPKITVQNETEVEVPQIPPTLEGDVHSTTTASTSDTTSAVSVTPSSETETTGTATLNPLSVKVAAVTDSTYLRINVGNFAPETVEVYSRIKDSTEVLFLGLATNVQGEWILSLSALDLPMYEHTLYASFVVQGKTYQTDATSYIPDSATSAYSTSESELSILVQKIELALATSDVKNNTRHNYFSHIASTTPTFFDTAHEVTFADDRLLDEADVKMQLSSESIDRLLGYYASAVQGGQKYLLDLAGTKLVEEYKLIARNSDIAESTTALETLYALRFQALKDRVRDMEQQVGDETNNLTARDTDTDGFSDFDEIANFGSDPAKADTDKDGVLDSIEIIGGFDPLVSDIQAVPALSQNIDERVFDEVLRIRGVEAVTLKTSAVDKTYAVVHGVSIPNSYVTILSYTLGTVGVIRTNIEGEFSYTLEKDLIEGEYEVVAVLTDNVGKVVASSVPFRFTRTKQALVAAATGNEAAVFAPQNTSEDTLPAVITASVAVAAFGFLLLLLSQTLERRRRELVSKPALKALGS